MGAIILVLIIDYGSAVVLFSCLLVLGQMGKASEEEGGEGEEVMKFFENAIFVASIQPIKQATCDGYCISRYLVVSLAIDLSSLRALLPN